MSYSSLWLIDKNFIGHEEKKYANSWLFSPIIWTTLSDKYLPRVGGFIQDVISFGGQKVWNEINTTMNNSQNAYERICWELSNQQIFFSKDANVVANAIKDYLATNSNFGDKGDDGLKPLMRSHIIERWETIANDIENIDAEESPYFVLKNTSVDDSVERWFEKYDEDTDTYTETPITEREFLAEFVVIENGNVKEFVPNDKFEVGV